MVAGEWSKNLICIVDDDVSFREALAGLVSSFGYETASYASAQEFLVAERLADSICLILDVQMPGMNGLELQARLKAAGETIPTIFITSYADPRVRAAALKAGALGVLGKPFDRQALINLINASHESQETSSNT